MVALSIWSSFLAVFILSCQALGLQTLQEACNSPLGIQNGKVPDNRFSASSYSPYLYIGGGEHKDMKAKYCRLNHQYAWCTNGRNRIQSWFMVDLGRIRNVTGISTQGYAGVGDYYVTSFKLAYSNNKTSWKFVENNGTAKEFLGNKHGLDIKNNRFDQIQARFIKVIPINYHVRICLRIELYGCAIKDSFVSATANPTTPCIISTPPKTSHLKVSTSSKSSTTLNAALTSSQLPPSTTTKPTSIQIAKTISASPTITTRIRTSSHTTGPPSHHSTTTVPSSPLAPTASSPPHSKGPTTVAMTTVQPCEGATLQNAFQRQSSDVEEKKIYYIVAGFIGGLVLVVFPWMYILFIILRRRKRKHSMCQLVDLPAYPYDNQVDCNESVHDSLIVLENNSSGAVEL